MYRIFLKDLMEVSQALSQIQCSGSRAVIVEGCVVLQRTDVANAWGLLGQDIKARVETAGLVRIPLSSIAFIVEG